MKTISLNVEEYRPFQRFDDIVLFEYLRLEVSLNLERFSIDAIINAMNNTSVEKP